LKAFFQRQLLKALEDEAIQTGAWLCDFFGYKEFKGEEVDEPRSCNTPGVKHALAFANH
jgi:hypothetical protein